MPQKKTDDDAPDVMAEILSTLTELRRDNAAMKEDNKQMMQLVAQQQTTIATLQAAAAERLESPSKFLGRTSFPVSVAESVTTVVKGMQNKPTPCPKLSQITSGVDFLHWLADCRRKLMGSKVSSDQWVVIAISFIDPSVLDETTAENIETWEGLVQTFIDMHCPMSEILRWARATLRNTYNNVSVAANSLTKVENLLAECGIEKPQLPDVWKNILLGTIINDERFTDIQPHVLITQSKDDFRKMAIRVTVISAQQANRASYMPSLNALSAPPDPISDPPPCNARSTTTVHDFDAFKRTLDHVTDAMLLNVISNVERETTPLTPLELNYIAKGMTGPRVDKVTMLVSKMSSDVRDALRAQGKCFICKQKGHFAVACPKLPDD